MNRSESKYFATAERMDEAFLALLQRKDFAYITVKELCAAAGVNRSTFYLHYETLGDLLTESVDHMNRQFYEHMAQTAGNFINQLETCPLEDLYLITPEYLTPYLEYVRDHQRLLLAAMQNADVLLLQNTYERMFQTVFQPILRRYGVREADRRYVMTFYIHGIMSIIGAWLQNGCADSIEDIIAVIRICCNTP